MDGEDVRSYVLPLLDAPQMEELHKQKTVDLSFAREGLGRFRVNIHHQRGTLAASIRLLPSRIPSLETLHLPGSLAKLAERRQGLVLVTGPTGCGKSSTLAALIDIVNSKRQAHVVTIEDPIEYQHANRGSFIEQIEVGRDTPDFSVTLRSIMRQTPDVILVGEMRDAETMATAMTAAETGHLALSTLHTNDAIQATARILDAFPAGNYATDAAAIIAGAGSRHRAATGAGARRHLALAGDRGNDRYRRGAGSDSKGRRSSTSLPDLRGQGRGHDDHGAIAGRSCADESDFARDGFLARVPYGRSAALFGIVRFGGAAAKKRIDDANAADHGARLEVLGIKQLGASQPRSVDNERIPK